MEHYRQEVLNTILAQILDENGLISSPENILKESIFLNRRMPDIVVSYNGLRLIIEGEVGDNPNAQQDAMKSCEKRVKEGICHIAIAVVYPPILRNISFSDLKQEMKNCIMEIAIYSQFGESEFIQGDHNNLGTILKHTYDQIINEDALITSDKGFGLVNLFLILNSIVSF